ncbi:MAG: thioredoxin fold domain-containing protein [Planctomycetota bacterium]
MTSSSPASNLPPPPSLAARVGRWSLLLTIALVAALGIDLARKALAVDRVAWRDYPLVASGIDFAASPLVQESEPLDRPRLLRFTAEWCGACINMRAEVFSRTQIADDIHARFVPYSVDLTQPSPEQQAFAGRYRVTYLPTLLVLDGQGNEIARLDEFADHEAFMRWLDAAYDRWDTTRPPTLLSRGTPAP